MQKTTDKFPSIIEKHIIIFQTQKHSLWQINFKIPCITNPRVIKIFLSINQNYLFAFNTPCYQINLISYKLFFDKSLNYIQFERSMMQRCSTHSSSVYYVNVNREHIRFHIIFILADLINSKVNIHIDISPSPRTRCRNYFFLNSSNLVILIYEIYNREKILNVSNAFVFKSIL